MAKKKKSFLSNLFSFFKPSKKTKKTTKKTVKKTVKKTTKKIKIKKYGFYRVADDVLQIQNMYKSKSNKVLHHEVIAIDVNYRTKKARVRNFTKLERKNNTFRDEKLELVKNGKIIVIPQSDLKSEFLTGLHTTDHIVDFKDLKPPELSFTFPKKYSSILDYIPKQDKKKDYKKK